MTQSYALVIINTLIFGLAYLPTILREEEYLMETVGNRFLEYGYVVSMFRS